MTNNFTPGPWMTDLTPIQEKGSIAIFAQAGVACIALIQPGCLPEEGRQDASIANAMLIAAAPNLFSACQIGINALLRIPNRDDAEQHALTIMQTAIHQTQILGA